MVPGDIDMVRVGEVVGVDAAHVRIDRATVLGNPFEMRSEAERQRVIAAYREFLRGSASAGVISQRHGVRVAEWHLRKHSFEARMRALSRLAERVRAGQRLRLCCSCGSTHEPVDCHGDVIVEWVRARS